MKKIIVFGSFDPVHEGHRNFLNHAKELGDFLTVVVARDNNIEEQKNHKPMFDEQARLKAVRDLGIANKTVLGGETGEYEVLDSEKPDIIALGYDQKIPQPLINKVKKYKVITLKPFKPDIYKSSKIRVLKPDN